MVKKLRLMASGKEAKSWLELEKPLPSILGVFMDDGKGAFAEVKSNVKPRPEKIIRYPHALVVDSFEKIGLYTSENVTLAEGLGKDRRRILLADKQGIRDFVDAPPLA